MSRSFHTLMRVMGVAGILFFLTSAFTPLPNLLSRWMATPSRLESAEAIVVLGGSLHRDGTLSSSSLRRALQGIALHQKGLAPLLVMLGEVQGLGPAEAAVRAGLARALGVSPDVILTEVEARTTREEAARVSARLHPMGVRRILLVTDSLHMARARQLFERVGFDVFPAPADDFSSAADGPEGRLKLMRQILRELFAQCYYWVAGYV